MICIPQSRVEAFDEVDKDEASGERDQTITVDLVVEDQEIDVS